MGRRKTKGEDSPLSFFPSFLVLPCASLVNGELKKQQWRRLRKSHLKSDWAASNFIGAYSIWQTFRELNSKRLYRRSEKEKESRCLVFKISTKREIQAFSRRSRAVTDKKCTKKRDTRGKLFFYQSIPVGFLLNLLPSLSPLLTLHNINRRL